MFLWSHLPLNGERFQQKFRLTAGLFVVMKIKTKLRKYWISCVLLNAWMPRVFSFSSIVMQCFLSLALLLDSFVLKTKSWSFCSSLLLISLLTPTNFFIIVTCQYAPSNQCLFFFFFFIFHFSLTLIWCWQVKNLLSVDYRDAVPLRKMIIRRIPRYDVSNFFSFLVWRDVYMKVPICSCFSILFILQGFRRHAFVWYSKWISERT